MAEPSAAMQQLSETLRSFVSDVKEQVTQSNERITAMEQHLAKGSTAGAENHQVKSIGATVAEHPQFKQFVESGFVRSGRIPVQSFFGKSTILTTPDTAPLPQRIGTIATGRVALRLRNFMNVVPATSDTIEFVKLTAQGSTNNAAPQGFGTSPAVTQGATKAESAMAFSLAAEPVITIAHWIPASKQVISDKDSLAAFVNSQLLFWLAQVEERNILNGIAASGELNGLTVQATPYDSGSYDQVGDTRLDTARHVRTQLELSGYQGSVIVVNPWDYEQAELTKASVTTGGQYIIGSPGSVDALWGMNVVSSAAMAPGTFVAFDSRGVFLYDRMAAVVEVSREHSDYFVRNLLAILAEERVALVVPDVLAVVAGTFPSASPLP